MDVSTSSSTALNVLLLCYLIAAAAYGVTAAASESDSNDDHVEPLSVTPNRHDRAM